MSGMAGQFLRLLRKYRINLDAQQIIPYHFTGTTAGNQTVTGVDANDRLLAVIVLPQLNRTTTSGAAAAADITVTGITTADRLVGVSHITSGALTTSLATANRLSEASITDDNDIQLSTTDTTGDELEVFWEKASKDVSSEFFGSSKGITAANTITNTGGTDLTGRACIAFVLKEAA